MNKWPEKEGFRKIISDVGIDNDVSRKWHSANGFRKVGRIKELWNKNEDVLVFSRDL